MAMSTAFSAALPRVSGGPALMCPASGRRSPSCSARMFFGVHVDVPREQMQHMLRRDIQRRYDELTALGWLGRVWLAVPLVFDVLWPNLFKLDAFEPAVAPCYRRDDGRMLCTFKESSVLARGIPFHFELETDGGVITRATLLGIGPDLCGETAVASGWVGDSRMDEASVEKVCRAIQANRGVKRLLVLAVVSTIFQRLGPVSKALEEQALLEECGSEVEFVPRKDLWAMEGSAEKWLQQVAGYYFAESRLQTVHFAAPAPASSAALPLSSTAPAADDVRFDFYLDPTEPLNSEDLYRNINPEVISCRFPAAAEPLETWRDTFERKT